MPDAIAPLEHERPWILPTNVSPEHLALQNRALVWLAARASFYGVRGRTEFQLFEGYQVDAFALCTLQARHHRELCRHSGHMVDIPYGNDGRTYRAPEIPQGVLSHAFEVKVSKADFRSTFGDPKGKHANRFEPAVNYHWCVTPKGLVKPSDLPDFWGLLEGSGAGLRVARLATHCEIERELNDEYGHRLLWTWPSEERGIHLRINQCPNCQEAMNCCDDSNKVGEPK